MFSAEQIGPGGGWIRKVFENERPLVVELGCGKGEYSLALSRFMQDANVVGIDRKGDRLWRGARLALQEGIPNVAFLRADIKNILDFLNPLQVSTIWIPFPDPLPKRRQAKHRIVSAFFLEMYRQILEPEGLVHFKTDDAELLDYVLETLKQFPVQLHQVSYDLYCGEEDTEGLLGVQTTFEARHLEAGRTIKYLSFSFTPG